MTETTTLYLTSEKEYAVAQSFTLYLKHIAEISTIQQLEGRKRSAIVQDAIDLYYLCSTDENLKALRDLTELSNLELIQRGIELLTKKINQITQEA
jgi:hypothetical protein